jgi:para-nitrobenzyl esterase
MGGRAQGPWRGNRVAGGGLLLTLALLALPANRGVAATDASALLVKTTDGLLRGTEAAGVRQFKGIPFAAPPLGALRFEPPAPVTPWRGVLDASQYGAACPQAERFGLTEASDDEDCLHLNVAVPATPANGLRPVLVWFYGGAFVGGSTKLYPLDYLAREGDIVVVSANYRLGPLGFMAHPAFDVDFNGSYALEDQRQALRWVQQNIAAFGGDPRNVTIGGVSAGAASVCMHLVAPERTAGLFHKAIIQSAGCTWRMRPVAEAQKSGLEVAKIAGCTDPATALACLRSKSAHDLVAAGTTVAGRDYLAFAPSYGTKAQPRPSAEAFASGNFVRVPILNGGAKDEMRVYIGYEVEAGLKITPEVYRERLRALYGSNADAVLTNYPLERYSSPPTALGSVMSDFMPGAGLNNCLFLRTAWLASRYVPVYEYEFADPNAPPVMKNPGMELGAVHTAEMPYQFPRFSNTSRLDGPDLAPGSRPLSKQMVAYWSAFVHTGAPSVKGLPEWQPFATNGRTLRLKPGEVGMFDAGAAHQCPFWEQRYPDELAR